MPKSELTKRAIAASFHELLETTPLEKVTVSAIAERTGINRQTFYYHFHDIYDLLSWIYRNGIAETMGEPLSIDDWQKALLAILRSLSDNHDLVMRTIHGIDASFAYRFAQDEVSRLVKTLVVAEARGLRVDEQDVELVTRFYSAGLIQVVHAWVSDGMCEDPERLVGRLGLMLSGVFAGSLRRLSR